MIRSTQSNKDPFPISFLVFCFLFLSGAKGFCFLFSHSLLILPTTDSLYFLSHVASSVSQRPIRRVHCTKHVRVYVSAHKGYQFDHCCITYTYNKHI